MEKNRRNERRAAVLGAALAILLHLILARYTLQRMDVVRYSDSRTPYTITGTEVKI